MSKVIAIASSKGGVGKTTAAINIGAALSAFGRRSIVIDGNLSNPNVGLHLGAPMIPHSLHDVMIKETDAKESIYMHDSGLMIVPGSISMDASMNVDPSDMKKVIKDLKQSAEVLIMDSASGMGENVSSSLNHADEAIIITTPDMPSVTDALKTIHTLENSGVTIIGSLINRARGDNEELTSNEVEGMLGFPVLGIIPEDNSIRDSLKICQPVVNAHPHSPSADAFKSLAALLVGQQYKSLR